MYLQQGGPQESLQVEERKQADRLVHIGLSAVRDEQM
jgi:hypothetical protein